MTRSYAPVENWKQRQRYGMSMTRRQLNILKYLREAKQADPECPYTALPGVPKATVRSLMEKGWIFISPGLDGTKYYLSDYGERALRIFEQPVGKRYDGICSNCCVRPVHISPSGRRSGYCLECGNELSRRKYHHGVPRASADHSICPRCNKRPRHVNPGGKQTTYCLHCKRVMARQNKRKNRKRKIERARRGELFCCICKVQPVHYTDNSVYDYCREHLREYMNAYNDRRRPNSRPARQRQENLP